MIKLSLSGLLKSEETKEIFKIFCKDKKMASSFSECLARLIIFDQDSFFSISDIENRISQIKELKNDSTSLKSYILRYGEKEGIVKYNERISRIKYTNSLDYYIEKFGEKQGRIEYDRYRESNHSVSLDAMKKRYGDKKGIEKWDLYLEKKRNSYKEEYFIEKYGEKLGKQKYLESKEIWKKCNSLSGFIEKYGEEEGNRIWDEKNRKRAEKTNKKYIKENIKDPEKEMDKRFGGTSLSKMIKKYGDEEGKKRYTDKIEKNRYSSSNKSIIEINGEDAGLKIIEEKRKKRNETLFKNKSFHTFNYSKCSQQLFKDLHEYLLSIFPNIEIKVKYASIGKEFFLWTDSINDRKIFFYDFVFGNKIIEFNGDYFHCNPLKYSPDYYNTKKKMHAHQIWEFDEKKIKLANSKGYEVLVIWQNDYKKHKNKIENICKEFLKK